MCVLVRSKEVDIYICGLHPKSVQNTKIPYFGSQLCIGGINIFLIEQFVGNIGIAHKFPIGLFYSINVIGIKIVEGTPISKLKLGFYAILAKGQDIIRLYQLRFLPLIV